MSSSVDFSILFDGFRDKDTIFALKKKITEDAKKLQEKLYIMEVCGGHTHTIMKYGINQMMPENIEFENKKTLEDVTPVGYEVYSKYLPAPEKKRFIKEYKNYEKIKASPEFMALI